ncbi:SEC-C domain-containing protein [Streptococcus oralis]|uniref:YecA family protein n=1 Tax=Streptococcus oralis TaxID=1303 RepID=UPI00300E856D
MSLGRNDKCYCGSGKKYKKCHLDLDKLPNRMEKNNLRDKSEENLKNIIVAAEKIRLRENLKNDKCFYKNCSEKPIGSHTIHKSLLKGKLSEGYKVINSPIFKNIDFLGSDDTSLYDEQSFKKATVFPGFCKKHDAIFESIENKNLIKNTSIEDYIFLYSYRALVNEYWLLNSLTGKNNNKLSEFIKGNPRLSAYPHDMVEKSIQANFDSLDNYKGMKMKFEKYIDERGALSDYSSDFKITYSKLDMLSLEFAATAIVNRSKLVKAIGIVDNFNTKVPICVGILPEYENIPNLFFAISTKDNSDIINFINTYKNGFFIQNLVVLNSQNIVFAPEFYDRKIRSGEFEKFEKIRNNFTNIDLFECLGFDFLSNQLENKKSHLKNILSSGK